MKTPLPPILQWSARISAILVAGLFLLFVVTDMLSPSSGPPRGTEWIGIFFITAACLMPLAAWRWELPAAVVSLVCLALFATTFHLTDMAILGVIALPPLLFIFHHFSKAGFRVHA